MKKLQLKFDGKKYEIREALEPLLLLEKEYGNLADVPETLEAQLKYFYYLMVGCNDEFDYSFEKFVKLLPYQKGLLEDLKNFTEKK